MTPRKLSVCFAGFPYAGNGSTSSEHPRIRHWMVDTVLKMREDERIEHVFHFDLCDTPITMTRNKAVEQARLGGADVLVMVDSDQVPDVHLGFDQNAKPFWDTSFDFLFKHYDRGPVVIASPYCGPPPVENVYAFYWHGDETDAAQDDFKLEAYSRQEAAQLSGIIEAGAAATGLIMYDMRVFDLIEPPYFFYEYKGDGPNCPHCHQPVAGRQTEKCSTEDVTFTREISHAGIASLGYNPLHINWDAWAGHAKPKIVGKPNLFKASAVNKRLRRAFEGGARENESLMMIGGDNPRFKTQAQVQAAVKDNGEPSG